MSDEPSSGYNASPAPSVGSTASIGTLVAGRARSGSVVEVVEVVVVVVVDTGGVDDEVVVSESSRRPTPLGDPDEHAAASPKPISRIAATRSEPARRTARTVPGDTGSVGASRLLDDF